MKVTVKTYEEYINFQKSRATWNRVPFAQKVALELLEFAKEIGIKPITKAYIGRGNGLYQTTCISFPHLPLHVQTTSIRETEKLVLGDIDRCNIFYPTEGDILVVDSTQGMEGVQQQIAMIKEKIRLKIESCETLTIPWDLQQDIEMTDLISKNTIHINDHKHFYLVKDIVRIFGDESEAVMTGEKAHKFEPNTVIWWPKLYKNKDWENELSSDGMIITEKSTDVEETKRMVRKYLASEEHYKIAFPRYKEGIGDSYFMFKGVFKLDKKLTNEETGAVFRRISQEARLYFKQK